MEFRINIEDTTKEYIDGLILGLVHAGYNVYFDIDKDNLIFVGYLGDVCDITQLRRKLNE